MRWLDNLLHRWGKASVRAMDGGLGYTRSCLANMNPSSGNTWNSNAPAGALMAVDFHELNEAIQRLEHKERVAVVTYYQLSSSYRQAALLVGCATNTLIKRVQSAQGNLARILHEMEQQRKAQA